MNQDNNQNSGVPPVWITAPVIFITWMIFMTLADKYFLRDRPPSYGMIDVGSFFWFFFSGILAVIFWQLIWTQVFLRYDINIVCSKVWSAIRGGRSKIYDLLDRVSIGLSIQKWMPEFIRSRIIAYISFIIYWTILIYCILGVFFIVSIFKGSEI